MSWITAELDSVSWMSSDVQMIDRVSSTAKNPIVLLRIQWPPSVTWGKSLGLSMCLKQWWIVENHSHYIFFHCYLVTVAQESESYPDVPVTMAQEGSQLTPVRINSLTICFLQCAPVPWANPQVPALNDATSSGLHCPTLTSLDPLCLWCFIFHQWGHLCDLFCKWQVILSLTSCYLVP